MKYGYARVSTRQQDLEGQLRQLEEERCDRVYFEKITGTKSDRPEFQKLLQEIETGDTLVVTKLDRFARSTQDALNTIKLLFEKCLWQDKPTYNCSAKVHNSAISLG